MDSNYPPGPPELPKAKPIQLIASTKPATPEPVDEEDATSTEQLTLDELNEHVDEPGDPDGIIAAEEQRTWQERHPVAEPASGASYKRKRRWPIWLAIVAIIAAAAAAAYWFGSYKGTSKASKTNQNAASSTKPVTQAPVTATKHYDSTTFTLGFDYPTDWVVSDTTAKLTVTSPSIQLKTAAGQTAAVHTVLTIQNQQTTIAGYPVNGALAALASDKLTYKQPTTIQRAQTYVSYLSYASANDLTALYITGDNGYQQGQQVPLGDVVKGNPLISVSFETCTDATCATGTPSTTTLHAADWKETSISKQVADLIKSIQLN